MPIYSQRHRPCQWCAMPTACERGPWAGARKVQGAAAQSTGVVAVALPDPSAVLDSLSLSSHRRPEECAARENSAGNSHWRNFDSPHPPAAPSTSSGRLRPSRTADPYLLESGHPPAAPEDQPDRVSLVHGHTRKGRRKQWHANFATDFRMPISGNRRFEWPLRKLQRWPGDFHISVCRLCRVQLQVARVRPGGG